jgi:hypothetical protein
MASLFDQHLLQMEHELEVINLVSRAKGLSKKETKNQAWTTDD